jgi:hypothetical protein
MVFWVLIALTVFVAGAACGALVVIVWTLEDPRHPERLER